MARVLAAAPGVALLAWAAFSAAQYGVAGSAAANGARELERSKYMPAFDADEWWSADVHRAKHAVPGDPTLHELDALIAMRTTNDPDKLELARRDAVEAIDSRPGSGYAWATLMAAQYRLGDTGASFEKAIVNAQRLGPFEPEVQQAIANYGLAVIDDVKPETRAAIERAVAEGLRRNPQEIMQIAARRGRLAVACRHLEGESRLAASKWSQICQSMEATS